MGACGHRKALRRTLKCHRRQKRQQPKDVLAQHFAVPRQQEAREELFKDGQRLLHNKAELQGALKQSLERANGLWRVVQPKGRVAERVVQPVGQPHDARLCRARRLVSAGAATRAAEQNRTVCAAGKEQRQPFVVEDSRHLVSKRFALEQFDDLVKRPDARQRRQ